MNPRRHRCHGHEIRDFPGVFSERALSLQIRFKSRARRPSSDEMKCNEKKRDEMK
jgi:hypothetical protein